MSNKLYAYSKAKYRTVSKQPQISIITPNFNNAAYIEETLQSVISQKSDLVEYIVVDGGSTDESLNIIDRYADAIDLIISEPDEGQADAINKGISRASGKWISFLNSDDYYFENTISDVLSTIRTNDQAHWIVGETHIKNNEGHTFKVRLPLFSPNPKPIDWVTYNATSPQPSTFIKKELFDKVGLFDASFHYAFDSEFWLRLHLAGYLPLSVDSPYTVFRIHEESKTQISRIPFLNEHRKMLLKHNSYFTNQEKSKALKILDHLEAETLSYSLNESQHFWSDISSILQHHPATLLTRPVIGALKNRILPS